MSIYSLMARPVVIRDADILESARAVFLELGVRATTAEVAKRAGVAEGSVFKRFGTKDNLFAQAMLGPSGTPPWLETLEREKGSEDPRATLVKVGIEAIEFFRTMLPLLMMAWSNAGPRGLPLILTRKNPPPAIALRALAVYVQAEVRAKRIRPCDPRVVARAYLGGLVHYVLLDLVLGPEARDALTAEEHVRGLIDVLWKGLDPHRQKKPKSRKGVS